MTTGHKNRPQAKDLPDIEVLAAMRDAHDETSAIHGVLRDLREVCGEHVYIWDVLAQAYHVPLKVVYTKMEKLYRRGFIEFGVSLRTGWPSEKGVALLAAYDR